MTETFSMLFSEEKTNMQLAFFPSGNKWELAPHFFRSLIQTETQQRVIAQPRMLTSWAPHSQIVFCTVHCQVNGCILCKKCQTNHENSVQTDRPSLAEPDMGKVCTLPPKQFPKMWLEDECRQVTHIFYWNLCLKAFKCSISTVCTLRLTGETDSSDKATNACFVRAPAGALTCEAADTVSCLMASGSEELISRVIRVKVQDRDAFHFPVAVAVPFCVRYRGGHREVAVKIVDEKRRVSYITPVTTEEVRGGQKVLLSAGVERFLFSFPLNREQLFDVKSDKAFPILGHSEIITQTLIHNTLFQVRTLHTFLCIWWNLKGICPPCQHTPFQICLQRI